MSDWLTRQPLLAARVKTEGFSTAAWDISTLESNFTTVKRTVKFLTELRVFSFSLPRILISSEDKEENKIIGSPGGVQLKQTHPPHWRWWWAVQSSHTNSHQKEFCQPLNFSISVCCLLLHHLWLCL